MVHARDPDRAERHGHRLALAEERRGQVDIGHVAQHPLAQRDAGQVGDVAAQRLFRIRAAIGIIEQKAWQPPPRRLPEIMRRGDHRASIIGGWRIASVGPIKYHADLRY